MSTYQDKEKSRRTKEEEGDIVNDNDDLDHITQTPPAPSSSKVDINTHIVPLSGVHGLRSLTSQVLD